ncbi:MAG TPA: hypothetical protein VKU02_13495 [Gemmataceae bacterium]|nr:hypothetical protein [Gemmataceae bacterium]
MNTSVGHIERTYGHLHTATDVLQPVFPTGEWVQVGFVVDTDLFEGQVGLIKVYVYAQVLGVQGFDGSRNNPPMPTIGIGVKTDDSGYAANASLPG